MVLLQINSDSILAVPFEGNAPRAIDVYGVADRLAAKPVEIKSGYIERLRSVGGIESIETESDPTRQVRPNAQDLIPMPQDRKAAMSEGPDHPARCKGSPDASSIES